MSAAPAIRWIERSPYLHEARVTTADGHDGYAGYVAAGSGQGAWRGYVGADFSPVGMGPRAVMQRAVEQGVADLLQDGSADQQRAAL